MMTLTIKPDNFWANPLGYIGNFSGHVLIAATIIVVSNSIWLFVANEYPSDLIVAGLVWLIYMPIELWQKDGKFWDCVEDIVVTCIHGPMIFLRLFLEPMRGVQDLSVQGLIESNPYILLAAFHMAVGAAIRLRQSINQGNEL